MSEIFQLFIGSFLLSKVVDIIDRKEDRSAFARIGLTVMLAFGIFFTANAMQSEWAKSFSTTQAEEPTHD